MILFNYKLMYLNSFIVCCWDYHFNLSMIQTAYLHMRDSQVCRMCGSRNSNCDNRSPQHMLYLIETMRKGAGGEGG